MEIVYKKFTVWHAAAVYIFVNGINWLSAGLVGDFEFYNSFVQPSIAPPDWLFAPMWFFLNITSLWALYRVANSTAAQDRNMFLWFEGIFWVLFAGFAFMYFGLQSPILAAINTSLSMIVTAFSIYFCSRIDRASFYLIGLRLIWLLLASYVGIYIAIFNQDAFFKTLASFTH